MSLPYPIPLPPKGFDSDDWPCRAADRLLCPPDELPPKLASHDNQQSFEQSFRFATTGSSHCQSETTVNPSFVSARTFARSRVRLAASFASQNSLLRLGSFANLHPRCPCQKQPWTKMTSFRCLFAKSGVPGNPFTLRRMRMPSSRRMTAVASSGAVPLRRTLFMRAERRGSVFSFVVKATKVAVRPWTRACNCGEHRALREIQVGIAAILRVRAAGILWSRVQRVVRPRVARTPIETGAPDHWETSTRPWPAAPSHYPMQQRAKNFPEPAPARSCFARS